MALEELTGITRTSKETPIGSPENHDMNDMAEPVSFQEPEEGQSLEAPQRK